MSYLARLKAAAAPQAFAVPPAKAAERTSCSSCSTEGRHFPDTEGAGLAMPIDEANQENRLTSDLQELQKDRSCSFCSDGGKRLPKIAALVGAIAADTGLPVEEVLGLLDADDREAMRTGSDPGRAEALSYAAKALVASPDPILAPVGTGFPRAVVVWTPTGRPMLAWADSAEQAEALARWNPASPVGREGA